MKSMMKVILFLVLGCCGVTYAAQPEVFVNQTAGFKVTKPAEWQYISADQNLQNIKALKLNNEEYHAAMLKYSTAPLVAMAKYPEPYDDVNPSFKVNIKPFGQLKGKPPIEIINLILPQFKKLFRDFDMVQTPTEVTVAGLKSAYVRINYTMELPDGRLFPTSSELWIVPRGDYFFIIGAGVRQDERTGSRKEIENILKTVEIDQ